MNSIKKESLTYETCLYDNKHKSNGVKFSCNIKIALIIKQLMNLMVKTLLLLINKINSPKPSVLLNKK